MVWLLILAVVLAIAVVGYYAWQYFEEQAPRCQGSYSWADDTLYDMLYTDGCVPSGWEDFFNAPTTQSILRQVSDGMQKITQSSNPSEAYHVDPDIEDVFAALHTTSLADLKVVILGQDPAPEPGEATGYAFDVPNDPQDVPTMGRIMMELYREGYCTNTDMGNTLPWADQGVLLLNSALTVQCDKPGPDCQYDTPGLNVALWLPFTAALLTYISAHAAPSVFILWGGAAQAFAQYVDASKHKVIEGGHPSPAAEWEDFFCQAYFYDTNEFLSGAGRGPVDWNLCPCSGTKDPTTMVCSECPEDCQVSANDEVDGLYYDDVLKYCDADDARPSQGLHDLEIPRKSKSH